MATQTSLPPAPARLQPTAVDHPTEHRAPSRGRSRGLGGRRLAVAVLQPLGVFVPVFLFGTFVTFLLGDLSGLSPAALQLGESATPDAVAQLERSWGLDRPFGVRYLDWFGTMLTGDFGRSWANNQPVAEQILQRAGVSLSVAGLGLVIGVGGGLALGVLPAFVVGILLVAVFAVGLGLFPSAGYVPLDRGFGTWIVHLILPAVALSLDTVADVARQLRVGLVQAYRDNYVLGARVRGLSGRRIFWVHALRNGLGPTLTILGLKFANLLGGAVVLESVFGLSGYGVFAARSALAGDVPAVQGVLVVAVVLVVVFNVAVNLLLNRLVPAAARGV
jgi:peptide/nickel transport system permease protein